MDRHRLARATGAVSVLAGFTHLVAPEVLLRVARLAYDRVLAVEFDPRESATRRVRLVGVALSLLGLVAAAVLRRLAE